MSYVQGFVCAVPNANREAYRQLASRAAEVFRENGAEHVVEAWGDDVPDGKVTSFPMAVKLQPDETVVFAWISWPSRDACESGMAASMKDPRMSPENDPMPFDGQRMIWGGFEPIVDVKA